MQWPDPMPTTEMVPNRLPGQPYSDNVLAFDAEARAWFAATYQFADVEGSNDGTWEINGAVFPTSAISHWMPLPPNPRQRSNANAPRSGDLPIPQGSRLGRELDPQNGGNHLVSAEPHFAKFAAAVKLVAQKWGDTMHPARGVADSF